MAGREPAGPFVAREDFDGPPWVTWRYDRATRVYIWRFADAEKAEGYASQNDDARGVGKHIREVDVNGSRGRAYERLDAPGVYDSTGRAAPGTGVTTGVAKVWWTSGDLVIEVMSQTATVEELVPVALAVKVSR